jgi:hypothetical protein
MLPLGSIGAALFVAGCGLDVTIMGGEEATAGQTVTFQVKLTNVSVCPVADDGSNPGFAFLPFLPQSFIDESPELQELCQFQANTAMSANLAEAGTLPKSAVSAMLFSAAAGAAPAICSGPGVTCESIPPEAMLPAGGVICSIMGNFAPGEMRTITCEAQASGSGTQFNIAASGLSATGVCKAGTGQGQPCDGDADCGAGGVCGDGICEGGGNNGFGCDNAGECPMGACNDCADMDGLGIDCSETRVVGVAGAPTVSPIGLVGVAVTLCAIAALRLRRSRAGRST